MTETNPVKRPGCSEVFDYMANILSRTESDQADLERQIKILKNFENEFFFDYASKKLKNEIDQTLSSIQSVVNLINLDDIPGPTQEVPGFNNFFHQFFPMLSTGFGNFDMEKNLRGFLSGMVMDIIGNDVVKLMEILIGCFRRNGNKVILDETRMGMVLKKWKSFTDVLEMIWDVLEIDYQIIKRIDERKNMPQNGEPPELFILGKILKDEAKEQVNYPSKSPLYDTIQLSSGVSAIFDAVSYSLFKTKSLSNLIRIMTWLKYFESFDIFKQYCNVILEDYQITLLKILTPNDLSQNIKDNLMISETSILGEKSGILALQLVTKRKIMISPSLDYQFTEFLLDSNYRNCLNRVEIVDPIWLCVDQGDFLTVKPKSLQKACEPVARVPDQDHLAIFNKLKIKEQTGLVGLLGSLSGMLVRVHGNQLDPGLSDLMKYHEDDLDSIQF